MSKMNKYYRFVSLKASKSTETLELQKITVRKIKLEYLCYKFEIYIHLYQKQLQYYDRIHYKLVINIDKIAINTI